jgi:hypothetical protein
MARKKPGIGAEASAFTMSGNPGLVRSLLKAPLRSIWRTSAWRVNEPCRPARRQPYTAHRNVEPPARRARQVAHGAGEREHRQFGLVLGHVITWYISYVLGRG